MRHIDFIIKFGGSIVTDKSREMKVDTKTIDMLASQLEDFKDRSFIIVHGAGSFGHPLAHKYQITSGYLGDFQIDGVVLIRQAMEKLNSRIVDILLLHGLPAVGVPTFSVVEFNGGDIVEFNPKPVDYLLDNHMIPVLYGDVVFDREKRWDICSGDRIIRYLCGKYDVNAVVMCTDVDGIYTKDPRKHRDARKIDVIEGDPNNILIEGSSNTDVTGGMLGKIREIQRSGVRTRIINGKIENNLRRALLGDDVGTLVIPR